MSKRLLFGLLLLLAVVAGYPYSALVVHRLLGTSTVAMTEADGTRRTLIMGPAAPLPGWLPMLPRSPVVTAAQWLPSPGMEVGGDLTLLTHSSPGTVRDYYMRELAAAGFNMREAQIPGLQNPALAAMLDISGILEGEDQQGVHISVQIRGASGLLLPSRGVQIHWQKPVRQASAVPG